MKKINFNDCNIKYERNIIDIEKNERRLIVKYNFSNYIKEYTTVKIYINAFFLQSFSLEFLTSKPLILDIALKKGEEEFLCTNISFKLETKKTLKFYEVNPYMSCIEITIFNNNNKGLISIEKP